jgi:antitoxin component YwqK of YwqJK toxin-antitoxin module
MITNPFFKKIFTLLLTCLIAFNLGFFSKKKTVDVNDLNVIEELAYWMDSTKPFSGISIEKDEQGNILSEAEFKNGYLHGIAKSYYPNGKIKAISHYEKGIESGLSQGFNEEGIKIYETQFEGGKIKGTLTQWDDQGNKKREAKYKNGKLNWEIYYKDEVPHGLETMYNENQKPIYQAVYENGKQIKEVAIDPATIAKDIGFKAEEEFGINKSTLFPDRIPLLKELPHHKEP